MADSYFTCNAVITAELAAALPDACKAAIELGGKLAILESGGEDDAGYWLTVWGLQVPSADALEQFVGDVGAGLGLDQWEAIDEKQFSSAERLLGYDDLVEHALATLKDEYAAHAEENIGHFHRSTGLNELELAAETAQALTQVGITNVSGLMTMLTQSRDLFTHLPGIDDAIVAEVEQKLTEKGFMEG